MSPAPEEFNFSTKETPNAELQFRKLRDNM
jgi:hypothetical protein